MLVITPDNFISQDRLYFLFKEYIPLIIMKNNRNVFEAVAMEMTLEISCLANRGLEETHDIIGVNHIENENLDIQPTSP